MTNPPPFILRQYQPTDFDAVLAVMGAVSQADALWKRQTADELRGRLSAASSDPRSSSAVWRFHRASA